MVLCAVVPTGNIKPSFVFIWNDDAGLFVFIPTDVFNNKSFEFIVKILALILLVVLSNVILVKSIKSLSISNVLPVLDIFNPASINPAPEN